MPSSIPTLARKLLPWLSLAVPIALIGGEVIRFTVFNIPIYPFEIVVLFACLISVLGYGTNEIRRFITNLPRIVQIGTVLVLLALALSTAQSDIIRESLGAVKSWFIVPMVFVVCTIPYTKPRTFSLYGIIALAVIHTVSGLFLALQPFSESNRFSGLFSSPNHYAALAVPALILSLSVIKKPWSYVCAGILGVGVLASMSLGGMLGLLAALFFYTIWQAKRSYRTIAISLLLLIGITGATIFSQRFSSFEGTSLHSRLQIWEASLHIIADNPITGTGLRGFAPEYSSRVGDLFGVPVQWSAEEAHNLILAIQSNLGILGLVGFALLLASGFSRTPTSHEQTTFALILISILAHGIVDAPFFKLQIAVITWIVIGWSLSRFINSET